MISCEFVVIQDSNPQTQNFLSSILKTRFFGAKMKAIQAVCLVVWCMMLFTFESTSAYRILGIFHTKSKSHYQFGSDLFTALANQGHEVTLVSPYRAANVNVNFTQIVLDDGTGNSNDGKFIEQNCDSTV